MKITLLSDERIRLEPRPGALTIEADSAEKTYSPFHMVASGLAVCQYSVLASWATNAGFSPEDLVIEIGWAFADDPHRVGRYDVALHWPSLPEPRRHAATRAAALCAVHATLTHSPEIDTELHSEAVPA